MNASHEDVVPADPEYRKKVLLATVAIVVPLGLVCSYYLPQYIEQLKGLGARDPQLAFQQFLQLIRIVLMVGLLLVSVVGMCIVRTGLRTLRAGRFPPPGMKVIRDTRIVTGSKAKVQAGGLIAVAVCLLVLQLFLIYYVPKVLQRLSMP